MTSISELISESQIIALFLSIGIGYLVGKVRVGKFSIGGVVGTLIVSILVSLFGGNIDSQMKNLFFAMFIYAVGYECGPQFIAALNINALKDIVLAFFLAFTALLVVLISAKIFHLNKGMAAGLAAGALTQSSMVGTASDALNGLALPSEELKILQNNLATCYAVSFLFGVFSPVLICITMLEMLFKKGIREDALNLETEIRLNSRRSSYNKEQDLLRQPFLVSVLKQIKCSGLSITATEESFNYELTIVKVRRNGEIIDGDPELILEINDEILVFAKAKFLKEYAYKIGNELRAPTLDWEINLVSREIILANKGYIGKPISIVTQQNREKGRRRATCLIGIRRKGKLLLLSDTSLTYRFGDVIEIYGDEEAVNRVAVELGKIAGANKKTDFIFLGLGLVIGMLLGMISFTLFGVKVEIGVIGALISGIFFGWLNGVRHNLAFIPPPTIHFMQDFGLTAFIAGVGLSAGKEAVNSLMHHGISIFLIGIVISVVPLVLTYIFGRYILKYNNVAVLAGAMTGARSADPAFGMVLERAGNFVPTASFTITFAIANVILTMWGPVIIALV